MDPEALSPDLINAVIHFTRIPHARRALYKLLNDPSFVHTDILDLPLEILERVVSFVDARDLIALRSTCKKLEKAATSSFAHQFIKCRRHVLSIYSLKTLVDIAAHPYFGKFIEAIILDTTWTFNIHSLTRSTNDGSLNHSGFCRALEEVFGHLSLYGNLNTLGVTDCNPTSFGIQELLSQPTAHLFKQERGHVLSFLRRYAGDVNINISQLDIDSAQALGLDGVGTGVFSFARSFTKGLSPSTSLKFKVSLPNTNDFGLIWNHNRRSLEMTGLTEWCLAVDDNMTFHLFYDMTVVSAANITELTLSGCHARMGRNYNKLIDVLHTCSRTLEKVKLSGIVIEGDSTWSPVLQLLARVPYLMEFELATLSRQVRGFVNSERQDAVILQIDEWFGHGDKVSAELEDLAAAVEADELSWESLNDTEKWTYHMTGRKKIPDTLEDESRNDSESITPDNDLDETIAAVPVASSTSEDDTLRETANMAGEIDVFGAMTQEEREQQEDLVAYWDYVKTSGQVARRHTSLESSDEAKLVSEDAQAGLHTSVSVNKQAMESDMTTLVEEVASMFSNLTLT
ncbi:hypothetical protein KCV07_g6370, partial [Aureobasidium melanogenum]